MSQDLQAEDARPEAGVSGPATAGRGLLPAETTPANRRLISIWLFTVSALVIGMILLGGATRLTHSGLSITEWDVIMGAVPPLGHDAWVEAFNKYKQIPEYQLVNPDMTLGGFKAIFWWEWSHRLLGRLIGLAFGLPLLVFVVQRRIGRDLILPLVGLFVLGGAQGALGWYMVKSGLVNRVDVSQYRLAAHLGLAFLLYGALMFMALGVRPKAKAAAPAGPGWRAGAVCMLALVYLQIILGAFVAGLDAGLTYNTWPLMDGHFVPRLYDALTPFYRNFFENHPAVQFDHRMVAYLVALSALVYWGLSLRSGPPAIRRAASWLLIGVLCQVGLGIWTLLAVVPLSLGLAHQAGAIAVFTLTIHLLYKTLTAGQPAGGR